MLPLSRLRGQGISLGGFAKDNVLGEVTNRSLASPLMEFFALTQITVPGRKLAKFWVDLCDLSGIMNYHQKRSI